MTIFSSLLRCITLSKGHPASMGILFRINCEHIGNTHMNTIDKLGIRGTSIWKLYSNVCNYNMNSTIDIVNQLGNEFNHECLAFYDGKKYKNVMKYLIDK